MFREESFIDYKKIASLVWLIGRSYAASPERHISQIKETEDKFLHVANKVREIYNSNKNFREREFSYSMDSDIDILLEGVSIVNSLNQEIKDEDNMISFCSALGDLDTGFLRLVYAVNDIEIWER